MPKLGLTMSEGVLAEWQVAPGDLVDPGQVLFVVETDKITNEIEAPAAGRIIEILVEAGETVEVGRSVALWTGPTQGAHGAMTAAAAVDSRTDSASGKTADAADGRILSTPLARRLAARAGLNLAGVTGTGPRGRIQAGDVRAALVVGSPPPSLPAPPAGSSSERNLRQLIAARVVRSKAEIPHFHLSADADIGALEQLREQLNTDPLAPRKVSVTVLLALACARALGQHPAANVVWRNGRAEPLQSHSIAIAVDTAAGVMAPVIPLGGGPYSVAEALDAAVARARAGRLGPADVGEAALGLSNVGMIAVRSLAPIIDPDQTFMLGVGAPYAAFRPDEGGAPRAIRQLTLSLACDHRAIDGAPAARLLATIIDAIERPLRLLI